MSIEVGKTKRRNTRAPLVKETMKIINAYFGSSLLETLELALENHNGDRFDVGVGFAKNLTGATFERFGAALDKWFEGGKQRRFRLFIGDHRHPNDNAYKINEKIKDCTEVAANLVKCAPNFEERMEVVFLHKLHAKFYSMWSKAEPIDQLQWAIIGSSNLTDAALEEKNIEMDIYLEPSDPQLQKVQVIFASVIKEAYRDGDSWGALHDKIEIATAKTRWEKAKQRDSEERDAELEAELRSEEIRAAEEQARIDSDQQLEIKGPV